MSFVPVLPDETESLCKDVPPNVLASLRRYGKERAPVGGFLSAVLANDLVEAISRGDCENVGRLPEIVCYVYNALPRISWGSPEKVRDWLNYADMGGQHAEEVEVPLEVDGGGYKTRRVPTGEV